MHNLIYARVSTVQLQDYTRQLNDLETEIVRAGNSKESIKIFAEKLSGYTKNQDRPALNEMLEFISKNPDSKIWVTEISRLGRNPSETRKTIDELSERKIPIFIQSIGRSTLDDQGRRDSIVNIILQVLMEFAHAEAEQMKTRIKSGKLAAAKKGQHSTNVYPYGYTKGEDKTIVIQPTEAEVIKMIFELYSSGKGIRAIATILNDKKIPTKFNLIYESKKKIGEFKNAEDFDWTIATVNGIIKNPIYKGQRIYKDEIIATPAIISEELFDLCTDLRENKTTRNYLTTYTYLLKDLMVCGKCGRNYYARYKPNSKGDKVYMCSSKITSKPCGQPSVNISFIETAIFNELLTDPTLWKYFSGSKDLKKQLAGDIDDLEREIRLASEQILDLNKKSDKLLELYLDNDNKGMTKARYNEKNNEYQDKIIGLEQKRGIAKKELAAKSKALATFDLDKINKEFLEKSIDNRTELRAIFQQFINKLIINSIGKKYFMVTMFLKFGDLTLPTTIKLFLDKSSLRFNPKYLLQNTLYSQPRFDNLNVLITDENEILNELETEILKEKQWTRLEKSKFLPIS